MKFIMHFSIYNSITRSYVMKKILSVLLILLMLSALGVSNIVYAVTYPTEWTDYGLSDTTVAEMDKSCGDNVTWTLYTRKTSSSKTEMKLVFTGTGDMYDYTSSTVLPYMQNSTVYSAITAGSVRRLTFTAIEISEGITSIGAHVFENITKLFTSYGFTIPSSVTKIGTEAFYDVDLPDDFTIPSQITVLEDGAFKACQDLTSLTLPSGLTTIGDYCFQNCKNITSVTIPDSVTSLGRGAFDGNTSLATVEIPDSIEKLEPYTFRGCTALTTADLSTQTEIPDYCFSGDILLNSITTGTLTKFGKYAFKNCDAMTSFTGTSSLTSIGMGAFSECDALKTVSLSGSTVLGKGTFRKDTALTDVTIGEGATVLTSELFQGCTSLKTISMPTSMVSIMDSAFDGDTSLTDVTLNDGLVSIGDYAFTNCTSLSVLTIPSSVTQIGNKAVGFAMSGRTLVHSGAILCSKSDYAFIYAARNDVPVVSTSLSEQAGSTVSAVPGDANNDSVMNDADLVIARQAVVGTSTLDDTASFAVDMNGDDIINVKDVFLIRKFILGL